MFKWTYIKESRYVLYVEAKPAFSSSFKIGASCICQGKGRSQTAETKDQDAHS